MSFGERMRARRGELDMTRAELAALLGVSPSAVGKADPAVVNQLVKEILEELIVN